MRAGGTGGGGTGGGKGKGGGKRTARPFAPAEADGTGGAKKGREGQKGPRVTQKQVLQWLKVPSLEQPTAVAIANRRPCNRCLGQLQSPSQTAFATAAWALALLRCFSSKPSPWHLPPPHSSGGVRGSARRAGEREGEAPPRQAGACRRGRTPSRCPSAGLG